MESASPMRQSVPEAGQAAGRIIGVCQCGDSITHYPTQLALRQLPFFVENLPNPRNMVSKLGVIYEFQDRQVNFVGNG